MPQILCRVVGILAVRKNVSKIWQCIVISSQFVCLSFVCIESDNASYFKPVKCIFQELGIKDNSCHKCTVTSRNNMHMIALDRAIYSSLFYDSGETPEHIRFILWVLVISAFLVLVLGCYLVLDISTSSISNYCFVVLFVSVL